MEKLNARVVKLHLANPWKIASTKGSGTHQTVIVELAEDGIEAIGEAAPSALYGETSAGVLASVRRLDSSKLSFTDVPGSMNFLASLPDLPMAAKCALNLALLDGAAK